MPPLELVAPSSEDKASTASKGGTRAEPTAPPAFDPKDLAIVTPPRLEEPPATARLPTERPSNTLKPLATEWPPAPVASKQADRDPAVVQSGLDTVSDHETGWESVRNRMRELGITRYWIEGEPGGLVRFRCVIPLAGRHAVGQQFEAEGDDELGAAEAALRRVALWRATEAP